MVLCGRWQVLFESERDLRRTRSTLSLVSRSCHVSCSQLLTAIKDAGRYTVAIIDKAFKSTESACTAPKSFVKRACWSRLCCEISRRVVNVTLDALLEACRRASLRRVRILDNCQCQHLLGLWSRNDLTDQSRDAFESMAQSSKASVKVDEI